MTTATIIIQIFAAVGFAAVMCSLSIAAVAWLGAWVEGRE